MTIDLFSSAESPEQKLVIDLGDALLHYYPDFLSHQCADKSLRALLSEVEWQQETIQMYGVSRPIPRLSAWYGDDGVSYSYSGIEGKSMAWTSELASLRSLVEDRTGECFNGVLANLYRNGQDSVSWHSDDELSLGNDPIVASLSLGEVRRFQLKHKRSKYEPLSLDLNHGSLLVMGKGTQLNWLHQVPKSRRSLDQRINLTFRRVFS